MTTATDRPLEALIEAELDELVALRRDLHAHPQLAYEETHASAAVQRELEALGIPFESGIGETGVVGWITPPDAAHEEAVALRADMDALPITERTGAPYASQHEGLMHACGHDGHTAMLIGAARVLAKIADRLPRPVKLLFQPAEEGKAGAKRMIEAGALTDRLGPHPVGAIFGLHGFPLAEVGTYTTRPGPIMAATDSLRIDVVGQGGHAAAPYQVRDPVVASAHVITALQTVTSRHIRPTDAAVVSVCSVHGGHAFNAIPERIEMVGTIRALDETVREDVRQRVREVAEKTAQAMGCRAEVTIEPGYPPLRNHAGATEYAMHVARDALGADRCPDMAAPLMGAEDFAFYAERVPACFGFLGVRPADRDSYPGLHHPAYDFGVAPLGHGVKLLCRLALDAHELPRRASDE